LYSIDLEDVHKRYEFGAQVVEVLRGIELQIPEKSFMAIMGPSGSGKTTLLSVLGGLEVATSGKVCVLGQHLEDMSQSELEKYRNRSVGFVFQSYNLIPGLSVLDNVLVPWEFARPRMDRRQGKERALALLEQVGLSERIRFPVSRLSGGEQQRAAVARALMNSPSLILADEPTGNLDSASGDGVLQLLLQAKSEGHTVVVATHNPQIALLADTVVQLRDGQVSVQSTNAAQATESNRHVCTS
jgi:putative ABC transport system ATP-binding protein